MPRPPSAPNNGPRWSLRLADQGTAAVILLVALGYIGVHWWRHQQAESRLVDIDRTPVLVAKFQIDINAADWPEFALLPGVGEVLAKRIVDDRQTNGPFRDWNDLRRVRGIGPKTFEGIKPFLLPLADLNATAGP
ncbi:Helix-hairpin-helix motif protein [Anatilimnocola aggregata]|uniref:Helix-hairpin-helix motif protein n=1 Tax=Anatilimnocola aggregata TaxID=2528021 RepID=A0A517Y6E2_9BACT|nr:helix-hairpin-helix domain-containing protein [Anatilimnocola aggregata]QDU25801.1 Helix-hairpin-helix motif protein [Anatilimnocola aggregata]